MKVATKILFQGSAAEIKTYVPAKLEAIKEVADNSATGILEVVEKFDDVTKLLDELYECGIETKSDAAQQKDENERLKMLAEEEKNQTEKITPISPP